MTSGYCDCACRDCFEIAMDGGLCSECEEAGCEPHDEEGDGAECLAAHAYDGNCGDPVCCPPDENEETPNA
jgi:hypothetical protein